MTWRTVLASAVEAPAGELHPVASFRAHVNGSRISARRPLAVLPGAVDLTERLPDAIEQLS